LAALDPDPHWKYGSGSRSNKNEQNFLPFKKVCSYMFFPFFPITYFKYIFPEPFVTLNYDKDLDPHWFAPLDPDLDPHFDKKLDPDPQ
jgi:hypothetical protein